MSPPACEICDVVLNVSVWRRPCVPCSGEHEVCALCVHENSLGPPDPAARTTQLVVCPDALRAAQAVMKDPDA